MRRQKETFKIHSLKHYEKETLRGTEDRGHGIKSNIISWRSQGNLSSVGVIFLCFASKSHQDTFSVLNLEKREYHHHQLYYHLILWLSVVSSLWLWCVFTFNIHVLCSKHLKFGCRKCVIPTVFLSKEGTFLPGFLLSLFRLWKKRLMQDCVVSREWEMMFLALETMLSERSLFFTIKHGNNDGRRKDKEAREEGEDKNAKLIFHCLIFTVVADTSFSFLDLCLSSPDVICRESSCNVSSSSHHVSSLLVKLVSLFCNSYHHLICVHQDENVFVPNHEWEDDILSLPSCSFLKHADLYVLTLSVHRTDRVCRCMTLSFGCHLVFFEN